MRTDPADPDSEIGSAEGLNRPYLAGSTTKLQQAVLAGDRRPGQHRHRPGDPQRAERRGRRHGRLHRGRADYTITTEGDFLRVVDNVGTDGTDLLRNVQQLQFSDGTIDLVSVPNAPVIGTATAGAASATVRWSPGTGGAAQPPTEHRIQVLRNGEVVRTVNGIAGDATSTVVGALSNDVTYTFRVIAVNAVGASAPSAESNAVTPDTAFPRVLSSDPADNAVGRVPRGQPQRHLHRAVSSPNWAAAVQLRNNATGALVGRVVTYDPATRTVTVNPNANLVPSRSYTMTLIGTGNNGIRDAAGVRLQTTTVDFTTRGDTTAPVVTTTTPADGATGVGLGANTVVNFSETVAGLNQSSVELRNTATGTLVPRALTVNAAGTRVTINPDANMARNTVYEVRLVGGPAAIRDAFDNPLATTTFTFRTRP